MNAFPTSAWWAAYERLAAEVPRLAGAARPLVAGFAACVDKRVDLHDLAPELGRLADRRAHGFFEALMARAAAGRGGEMLADWPEGPAFLDRFVLPGGMAVGGTSAQAAWTLARIGAPAIIALADRSADQLAVLDPAISLADHSGALTSIGQWPRLGAEGVGKPAHYIVEFTAGKPLPGLVPTRSTRVIVRFATEDIERDDAFTDYVRRHADMCGAALFASPNAIPLDRLPPVLDDIAHTARAWRDAGIGMIHLEFGDFVEPGTGELTLARLAGHVTSLGLNLNELRDLMGDEPAPIERLAVRLGETCRVSRVVIHGDHWAMAATRRDPWLECEALLAGCLLASARAEQGQPSRLPRAPKAAAIAPPPLPAVAAAENGWSIACCPAPYLAHPASTVGLGDSFTAGTLLIHSLTERRLRLGEWLSAVPAEPSAQATATAWQA